MGTALGYINGEVQEFPILHAGDHVSPAYALHVTGIVEKTEYNGLLVHVKWHGDHQKTRNKINLANGLVKHDKENR